MKKYHAALGIRHLIQMLPPVLMAIVVLGLWIWGDRERFQQTGWLLGLLCALWLGSGIWTIFGEQYIFSDTGLTIVSGFRRNLIPCTNISRVLAGNVTMKKSLFTRGALLIEQENGGRGQLVYPKDYDGFLSELKKRAVYADWLTTEEEVVEWIKRKEEEKKNENRE